MSFWPFKRPRAEADADRLLAAVTAASRRPVLFGEGRASDTLEGRFEVMSLNGTLALIRLQGETELAPLAQSFTDKLFRQFDAGLREEGVGDTSVPKRMRKMAGAFYGRFEAYAQAFAAADPTALAEALTRNGVAEAPFAVGLAEHLLNTAAQQKAAPPEALFDVDGWPSLVD